MLPFILQSYVDMPAPLWFDNWLSFWLVLVIALVNGIMMLFVGYKFLQILQLSGYKLKGYFEWLRATKARYIGRLAILSFLSTAALLVTNVLLEQFFVFKILTYLGLVFYFLFSTIFIFNMYNAPQKVPLKYTHRMNRLCVVLFVVVSVFTFLIMSVSTKFIPYLEHGALGLTPLFLPLFVIIAHFITAPFEHLNSLRYIKKAKNKLQAKHKDVVVIGVTGSYGKTTVKNILTTMLSEKFVVCATPYSYNTPLGLSKTILENLSDNTEIFVAEMGAKYVGDIKYLCEMARPNIGIITGIGNQHLATFGSQENLINTKKEMLDNLVPGGKAYINVDSKYASDLYNTVKGNKFKAGIEISDGRVVAKNIRSVNTGSEFDLEIDGNAIHCETTLLGKHNISNILICALVAYDLGVSLEQIKEAISKLVTPAHRLAIVPSSNSLVVIDDAYNGNVEGCKAALEVIKTFSGKKIVVTPGLVELGKDEYSSNKQFGIDLAGVADYVIIDGVVNYPAISEGLQEAGFDMEQCLRAGNLRQAVEVLNTFAKPGDVVLFENDLPDNYT